MTLAPAAPAPSRTAPAPTGTVQLPVGAQAVAGLVLGAVLLRPLVAPHLGDDAVANAATVFVAIVVQALPFLVLGVLLSGLVAAFVTPAVLTRLLPRRDLFAVPVAGLAGMALPGCECGAIPLAGRLVDRGARPAAALAFLLAAPAINPVVLVATSVAFPHRPGFVAARFLASLLTAVVTALVWARIAGGERLRPPVDRMPGEREGSRTAVTLASAQHDLLHAGGYLVLGAASAALLQTLVPKSLLTSVGSSPVFAVLTMATLALVLAICSQADAFVATGFTQFSLTARLVFLVVGPAVDLKLMTLQSATFGRSFMQRFAPLTLVVAVLSALAVGAVLL